MAAGELDLALLPVIELARIPGLVVVPGLAIGSLGNCRSVLLVARKPLAEVRSVALDPESSDLERLGGRPVRRGLGRDAGVRRPGRAI